MYLLRNIWWNESVEGASNGSNTILWRVTTIYYPKSVFILQRISIHGKRARLHQRTFANACLCARRRRIRTHPEMHGRYQLTICTQAYLLLFLFPLFDCIYCRRLMRETARTHVSRTCAQAPARATRTHIIMPKRYSRKRAFAWYIRGYMRDGVYVLPHDIRVIIRLAPAILRWCMAGPASYMRCPKLRLYSFRQKS